ncbi:MAG: hypothetical protein JWQ38_377 [Flavipsychrobacter sp.]|nr:hypothetical protein [Flavipsychrobacter sp.]
MEWVIQLFGEGKDLNVLQMSCRGIAVFLISLVLIRISGRRSFGIRTPLDNIIVILLGAIMSRAVVGASPFLPIIAVSFVFVILHRILAWGIVSSRTFSGIVEGEKICLYKDGGFIKDNMKKALVCEEDVMQGIRESAMTDDMKKINTIYMERNGEISVIKKEPEE